LSCARFAEYLRAALARLASRAIMLFFAIS
jgi:hypothetical protein